MCVCVCSSECFTISQQACAYFSDIFNLTGLSEDVNVGTETSLFADVGFAPGSDFSASHSRQFKPSFVTGLMKPGENTEKAGAICGSDIACLWSIAHYKDPADVQLLKTYSKELEDSRKNLGMMCLKLRVDIEPSCN